MSITETDQTNPTGISFQEGKAFLEKRHVVYLEWQAQGAPTRNFPHRRSQEFLDYFTSSCLVLSLSRSMQAKTVGFISLHSLVAYELMNNFLVHGTSIARLVWYVHPALLS